MFSSKKKIKTEWISIANRGTHYPLFMWDSIAEAWKRKVLSNSVGIDYDFKSYKRFDNSSIFNKDEWVGFVKVLKKVVDEDIDLLFRAGRKDLSYLKQMLDYSNNATNKLLFGLTRKELLCLIKGFNEIYMKKCGHWYIYLGLQKFLPDELARVLEKKLEGNNKRNFNDYFSILTGPSNELLVKKSKKALLEIALKIKSGGIISCDKDINNYINDYGFLNGVYYNAREITRDEVIERVNVFSNPKKELDELERKEEEEKEIEKELIEEFNFSGAEYNKIRLLRFYTFVSNYVDEMIGLVHINMRKVFTELGKGYGLTYEQITECTMDELYSLKIPFKGVLNERAKDYCHEMDNLKVKIFFGDELEKIKKKNLKDYSHLSEVKGVCGSKGYAKGKVKLVLNSKEISKVEKGDILIAYGTNIEYVSAMEKAAAIVTNEGGITCHAAIVSRELSVPCLIGTKIGTEVFNDGEIVEVDADKGVVRRVD